MATLVETDEAVVSINSSNLQTGSTCQWTLSLPSNFKSINKEIALARAQIYNAIPNIDTYYQNTQFSYNFPYYTGSAYASASFAVNLIPSGSTSGCYMSITDINNVFQAVMFSNGHYLLDTNKNPFFFASLSVVAYADKFTINYIPLPTYADLTSSSSAYNGFTFPLNGFYWTNSSNTGAIRLPIDEGYVMQVIIGANGSTVPASTSQGLAANLGFPVGDYPHGTSPYRAVTVGPASSYATTAIASTNIPQIAYVTSLIVQSSWVGNTQFNTVPQRIGNIPINAGYNAQITFLPPVLLYYSVLDNYSGYNQMNITLCRQDGTPLTDLVEAVQIVFDFHLRTRAAAPGTKPRDANALTRTQQIQMQLPGFQAPLGFSSSSVPFSSSVPLLGRGNLVSDEYDEEEEEDEEAQMFAKKAKMEHYRKRKA